MNNAIIGLSLPTYLFWLTQKYKDNFVFYEKSDLLGNWAPLKHNDNYYESACHILSLPNLKLYNSIRNKGFNLVEMNPQPCTFSISDQRYRKYFNFKHSLYYFKKNFLKGKYIDSLKLLSLFNKKFFYFKNGSFELFAKLKKANIVCRSIKNFEISNTGLNIDNEIFNRVFITPGTIFDNYTIDRKLHDFSFKEKHSKHILIHAEKVKREISYIRIHGHKNIFRISRANYSENDLYLVASDWNKEVTKDNIQNLFSMMGFCDSFEIIKEINITDRLATSEIKSKFVKYIYKGEKNFMSAAHQIFSEKNIIR